MLLRLIILSITFVSYNLFSAEKKQKYTIEVRDDAVSSILSRDIFPIILSNLDPKSSLALSSVNKNLYELLTVHVYQNVSYHIFGNKQLNGKRIQLRGCVEGIDQKLVYNYNEKSIQELCTFLKEQRSIKLCTPWWFRNAVTTDNKITEEDDEKVKTIFEKAFTRVLGSVKDNESLSEFTCSDDSFNISESMMRSIKDSLNHLVKLNFYQVSIEEEAKENFVSCIHEHPTLKSLSLDACVFSKGALNSFLYSLRFNTNLKELDLSNIKSSNDVFFLASNNTSITRLAFALYGNTTLTSLHINLDGINDSSLTEDVISKNMHDFSKAICKNTTLTELSLRWYISQDLTKPLAKIIQCNTSIKSLNLYKSVEWVHLIDKILDSLSQNSTLTKVNLGGSDINKSLAKKYRHFIDNNTALKRLDLKNVFCEDENAQNEIKDSLTSNTTKLVNITFSAE